MFNKDDLSRATGLLNIVQLISTVAPGFTALSSEAMAELREMNQFIERKRMEEAGRSIMPAPVGDPESPPPSPVSQEAIDSGQVDMHPTATKPIEADTSEPMPEVTPQGDMFNNPPSDPNTDPNLPRRL